MRRKWEKGGKSSRKGRAKGIKRMRIKCSIIYACVGTLLIYRHKRENCRCQHGFNVSLGALYVMYVTVLHIIFLVFLFCAGS